MASKNIVLKGATWNGVESVDFPVSGGGTALYVETSDADATASDIASGKKAYVNGSLITGSATAPVLTTKSITQNGIYNASSDSADGYSSVTVNVSGGSTTLKLGVLRPDAELVQKWTYDKYIVQDEGATLPSYTTTAQTLKASTLLSSSITPDFTSYCYIIVTRGLAIPVYSINTIDKGREEYAIYSRVDEMTHVFTRFGNTDSSLDVFSSPPSNVNRIVYWNSGTALRSANATSGANFANPTNTAISNNNLNIYSPSLRLQGSTSYLTNTYFNSLTDIRYQYIVELYREPLGSLNLDGFNHISQTTHIVDCMNTSGSTLT